MKFIVAEVNVDGNDNTFRASYLVSSQVGISESRTSVGDIKIFPNPVTDRLLISGVNEFSYFLVFDEAGRFMTSSPLKKTNSEINTSEYENGLYIYHVVDGNGKFLSSGKFSVIK